MTANEWPAIDATAVSASSDLFGGDLFGDELMDMYNSSAVPDGHDANIESIGDLAAPEVPHSTSHGDMADGGLDDGLGAFRPSTSFNDFGTLLSDDTSSAPPSPGGSVVGDDDSPEAEAEAAKTAGSKCGKRGGTRAATRAADKATGAPPAKGGGAKKVKTATGLGKTGGVLSPSPAKGVVGGSTSAKKRSRPLTSPKAPGAATDASAKKTKTLAAAPGTVKKTELMAPAAKAATVHPVSPTTAGKLTKPVAKGAIITANGKVVTNPLTPGSKAATAAAAKASASTAAASAAAAAKTVSTARRLITSTTSTTAVRTTAPMVVTASATAAAAAARAAAAKAAASTAQAKAQAAANKELTEHDFRGVAQAAVKNLMMSVGGKSGSSSPSAPAAAAPAAPSVAAKPTPVLSAADKKPAVNTSSSHIAALTSSNWVQACSEGVADASQAAALAAAAAANDPAQSKAARARRANLTPDERARQNRDRNREHARNTRLRKKAYVEELKKTLTELVAQRDAAELERRHEAQRDLEVREVRFRVMEEFLKLRSQGDNPNLLTRWSAIMEDGFTLTIPRTDYRPVVNGQLPIRRAVSIDTTSTSVLSSDSLEQVLKGPNEVMADAANLASFVNTFGSNASSAGPVRFAYHCERKNFMMDGVNAILHWTASTAGATAKGAPAEMVVKGMMKANFSPASNKLNSAELLFDAGCIASQARNLITTPTVVTTSQILSSALSMTDKTSADVDMAVNDADALLDSLQMPHVTSAGNMSTVVSTASMDGTTTPAISSCDEGEGSDAGPSGPATRRSARIH
mmetsp:Transcript_25278/g.73144  ORF Transcript_25278/g.73144 Transcript_25278/m.73144 type:complete len:804 (-) Transcript_25278:488-2899(-)|eukprot:CAMPEP_0181045168 /NCGR_PEP_ID=MMETSP1070-20121207/13662_1 /TAXON_ID=265543 /ORGANISM="Minutocellus polymorphus, Strain NH13" /LENGTH=803 /DNA_ID=CAMNT_0023123675 /DNA_START=507 /DNA_END=2918 /DNA_ORIENTATION=-